MTKVIGYENAVKAPGQFQFNEFRIVRELRFYELQGESSPVQSIDLIIECDRREASLTFAIKVRLALAPAVAPNPHHPKGSRKFSGPSQTYSYRLAAPPPNPSGSLLMNRPNWGE